MKTAAASLNSTTVRAADLGEVIDLANHLGFGGVGLWRNLYEPRYARQAGRQVRSSGLRISSVCRGGMFTYGTAQEKMRAWEDNQRALEEAHDLGAECLVLVSGGAQDRGLARARGQIKDGVDQLAARAAAAGVALAVEPMHPMMVADRSAITTLREATDLVIELSHPNVGIALDAYHVFWDPNLDREIRRASGRLLTVQISDWVVPIGAHLSSRGMPGEGSIDLPGFLASAANAGYQGLVEVEVLSEHWWAQPPADAADVAAAGLASI